MGLNPASGASAGPFADRAGPWVALLLPPLAWFSFELGLLTVVRLSCGAAGSWVGVAWGLSNLLLCGLAVVVGRTIGRRAKDRAASRPWLARLASIAGGIFALAIAFQTLAAWIVPPCAR